MQIHSMQRSHVLEVDLWRRGKMPWELDQPINRAAFVGWILGAITASFVWLIVVILPGGLC